MAEYLDVCRFTPTAGGTADWTFSAAVTGYQSPTAAGIVNSTLYKYRAESADLTQWEVGEGAYNTGTGVLPRTTVLFNNLGTTARINFSLVPQVAIVALAEDVPSLSKTSNTFTGALSFTTFASALNQNNQTRCSIRNNNAGASAYTILDFGNDTSGAQSSIIQTSSANAFGGGVNSLNLTTAGSFAIQTGGTTNRLTIDTSGNVSIPVLLFVGPAGTGNGVGSLILDGGSGSSGGSYVNYRRNGVTIWFAGNSAAVLGDSLSDLIWYNANTSSVGARVTAAKNAWTLGDGSSGTFVGLTTTKNATAWTPSNTNAIAHFIGPPSGENSIEVSAFATDAVFAGGRANGTAASPTTLANDDQIATFVALGNDGTGATPQQGGAAQFCASHAWSGTDHSNDFRIHIIKPATTALFEAVRVGGAAGDILTVNGSANISGGIKATKAFSSTPTVDTIGSSTSIAAAGNLAFATTASNGVWFFIRENTTTGDWVIGIGSGGTVTILHQSAASYVVTTTPAAGKYGVNWDGGTNYKLYNGAAAAKSFTCSTIAL
jgi:hypothetical protein